MVDLNIAQVFGAVESEEMLALIENALNDALKSSEELSNVSQVHHQRLFAVRSGPDGLLDAARQTLNDVKTDLYDLYGSYERQHPLANMKLVYTTSTGYHITTTTAPDSSDPLFINVQKHRRHVKCTTLALVPLLSITCSSPLG